MSDRHRLNLSDRERIQIEGELGLGDDSVGEDDLGTSDLGHDAGGVEVADEPIHIYDHGTNMQIVDPKHEGPFQDDWDHMVEQKERATVGPNGEQLSEFDSKFQEQGAQAQALQDQAPFTRTNPPSALAGILGSSMFRAASDPPVTVAYWVGDDAESCPVTVTLSPAGQVSVSGLAALSPYAIVQWGTRACTNTIEVDIGKGVQFTVGGSQVTVSVALDSPGFSTPNGMTLAGMLSFQEAASHGPALTRSKAVAVSGNSNQVIAVPPFARSVQFWEELPPGPGVSTAFRLEFWNSLSISQYIYVNTVGSYMLTPIPLTSSITQINVVDTVGGGHNGVLVFQLGL